MPLIAPTESLVPSHGYQPVAKGGFVAGDMGWHPQTQDCGASLNLTVKIDKSR